jgi:acetyl-CoA carboxylase biotin carboxyl carrier protein
VRIGARRPFVAPDPDLIRMLAELLTETGLSEIEYAVGDCRIRVGRDRPQPATPPAAGPTAEATPATPPASPDAVKAPMVGVVYLGPEPGAPPFVRLGDTISEGQVLLIIEAMKVMNQIRAPRAGQLSRIMVEDAEPVEYGAPLMLIE